MAIFQSSVAVKANKILDSYSNVNYFCSYISSSHKKTSFTRKLQSWHTLELSDFINELNKVIKKVGGEKLSKMDEMEWKELFEAKKKEALELKAEIDKKDREIDQLVYEPYGLSDEEAGIVESAKRN